VPGSSFRWAGLALACAAVGCAVLFGGGHSTAPAVRFGEAYRFPTLTPAAARRVRSASSWGGVYTASTGETVNVSFSDSYPVDNALGQSWADFFAGLVHGPELQLLNVYIAPPDEVASLCGNDYALGCYGSNQMVVIGEPAFGNDPHEVATHEYGHHVAFNRVNAPWNAIDWGTKHWASYENICERVSQGTAFPGDEGPRYTENPGEAFAETYRVLNDTKAGRPLTWALVDGSFTPDAAALQAVQADVLTPWTAPTSKTIRGRFLAHGRKTWQLTLRTPLDGELDAILTLPRGGLYSFTLLGSDGHTVLATGLWSGSRQKKLAYTVCGQRTTQLRVARAGAAGRFTVQLVEP